MRPHLLILVALLVGQCHAISLRAFEAAADPCAQYTSCDTCAGLNGCGWCSAPVTYADGSKGPQCTSPSTSKPFTCSGIYSTNQCLRGWECDQASGACRKAPPGQGQERSACESICTVGPVHKVYGCHNGSKTCVVVPAGTPGSSSRQQCENHCYTPAVHVYKCNVNTHKCEEVPNGTPGSSSKLVCQAKGCANEGIYGCDLSNYTCKAGAGNQSQKVCTADCRPTHDPCESYTTCTTCLAASSVCGWCSEDVHYASGKVGGRCAGVNASILPFNCRGTYSTKQCPSEHPTAAPSGPMTPSPYLPPRVNCPRGSTVLLQYNCADENCNGCNSGRAEECMEPHCTLYCSGKCQDVPAFDTSFMWTCNGAGAYPHTNATLVHYLKSTKCVGPTNPAGTGGSGTYPLDTCGSPYGPNDPPQYNTFMCVPCGKACDWHH